MRPFLNQMKKPIAILLAATSVLAALSTGAFAQTNVITVTNIVTITVTNIVTLTNEPAKADVAPAEVTPAAAPITAPPKYPWLSSIGAGLTLTRGNSDTLLVTASAATDKKTPDNEISLGADGAYGENNSIKDVDTIHGFGQYNHLFSERFYGYARAEGLHDGVADLQYRLTLGPGAGYYFLKETNTTFAGEFGTAFVTQKLGDETDSYQTLRLAENFEHKFKRYGARFWESVEILPQVNKFDNYIMNAEVGIESSLSATISLKTYLVDNFNNEPAAGREKNDVKLVSGISYKF
jgi:putative salt-induced outer membrane protein YdiY